MMTMGSLKPATCRAAGTPEKQKHLSPTWSHGLRSDSLEERQGTLGFSLVVLQALMCMDCRRGGEREREPPAPETDAGDITGVGTATRTRCGQNSLPVLNAHVVFRARAGREAGNLCLPEAVKIRQQDDESKEAGWLHTLQEERNGQPTSSHPT